DRQRADDDVLPRAEALGAEPAAAEDDGERLLGIVTDVTAGDRFSLDEALGEDDVDPGLAREVLQDGSERRVVGGEADGLCTSRGRGGERDEAAEEDQ